MMEHIQGKLHHHEETIHLENIENGKVIDHICIASANEALKKDIQIFWAEKICSACNELQSAEDKLEKIKVAAEKVLYNGTTKNYRELIDIVSTIRGKESEEKK